VPTGPTDESAGLSPEAYLDTVREALRPRRYRKLIEELRESCDFWILGPGTIDPCEPLTNRGRRTIDWPSPGWNSISSDLMGPLRWVVEGIDLGDRFQPMPPELAGYIAFVYLELCARESPAHDHWEDAIVHTLVLAARRGERPDLFRRYLIGWHDRAGTHPWNREMPFYADDDEYANDAAHHVALAIALGSADDPLIGPRVRAMRAWLDRDAAQGGRRFRLVMQYGGDALPALWREVVAASAPDAIAWGRSFVG